jgi:ABC-type multidrug transport system fused ATPase/permease subunit
MQKYLHTTWRLWKLLKPFHKDFYTQLILIMLSQLAGIFTIFLMSKVITFVVDKEFYFAAIVLVIHFSFNIFRSQLDYWKSRLSIKNIDQTIQQYIQEETFKKIFKLNPSQYLEDHSAIKIQVINRGENSVKRACERFTGYSHLCAG